MSLAKYIEAGKIELLTRLTYVLDSISSALFIGVILLTYVFLWRAVYSHGTRVIEGYTLAMMVWYLVLTESIVFSPGHLIEEIGQDIQTGNIAQNLNKPYNYLFFKYSSSMAKTLLRFVITFLIGSVIVFIFLGGISVSYFSIPLILVVTLLALTLHFMIMSCLGVLVFWLEDGASIYFIYQKIVFVLGGMLIPLEIFPSWLQVISKHLPFSYIAYYPAKLLVQFSWSLFFQTILYQLLWIAGFLGFTLVLYQICIQKISINGG